MDEKQKKEKYQSLNMDDIVSWCKANDKVQWLKDEAIPVNTPVYPRKTVIKETVDKKTGEKVVRKVSVADKSVKPRMEKRPPSFVQIKHDFVAQFMPELLPSKEKKQTIYDLINSL